MNTHHHAPSKAARASRPRGAGCRARVCLLVLILLLAVGAARAAQLVANDEGYSLSADFDVNLSRRIEEAINKGIALYFVADFELTHPRWYWFDEKVVRASRTFQLSYHALTRQYRLYSGALHQGFPSLEDALQVLSRLRWQVAEKGVIADGAAYVASVRLRLDPSRMAKTFQVSALSGRDWNLSSDWLTWEFSPSPPPAPTSPIPAPPEAPPPAPPDAAPPAEDAP